MHVVSVNVGRPRLVAHRGETFATAINKRPVAGPRAMTERGLEGDKSADAKHHGGPLQALCVYPHEHYAHFADKLGATLDIPSFGENLTTQGLLECECCIGDVLRLGAGAVVAITKPREPCSKLALKHNCTELAAWIRSTGYCGFYLRLVEPAPVAADDPIALIDRPHEGLTVAGAMRAMFDPDAPAHLIARYADCDALTPGWRERFARRLA